MEICRACRPTLPLIAGLTPFDCRLLYLWYRLTGQHARAAIVVNGHLAVDEHVRYAPGLLAGIVERRRVYDAVGVEEGEVGVVTLLDTAALGDTEALGRASGHAVHHALQGDGRERTAEAAEEARVGA